MTNPTGRYLYAITTPGTPVPESIEGINGAPVYTVEHQGIAAVVSDIEPKPLRPQRKNLAAHQNVLRSLVGTGDVLPISFGIVADTQDHADRLLTEHGPEFAEQLEQIKGCVEMGLRLSWDVENVFDYAVSRDSELAQLRAQLTKLGTAAPHDLKMAAGRSFEGFLNAERAHAAQIVMDHIDPAIVDSVENTLRTEASLVDVACLVERTKTEEFENAIAAVAEAFDDNHAFEINGPWAPHNFVRLELDLSSAA